MNNFKSKNILFVLCLIILFAMSCGKNKNPSNSAGADYGVKSVFVSFSTNYLDLDFGLMDTVISSEPPRESMDLYNGFSPARQIHSTIERLNGRQIAYLGSYEFSQVDAGYIDSITFTNDRVDVPFDSVTILLFKTDLGSVYKLGNPVEDSIGVRFDYQLLQEPETP